MGITCLHWGHVGTKKPKRGKNFPFGRVFIVRNKCTQWRLSRLFDKRRDICQDNTIPVCAPAAAHWGSPATSGNTRMYRESIIFPQLQNPCAATASTSVKCSVWRGAGMRWSSWGQQAKADEGHSCTKVRRPGMRRAKRPRDVMKMAQRG